MLCKHYLKQLRLANNHPLHLEYTTPSRVLEQSPYSLSGCVKVLGTPNNQDYHGATSDGRGQAAQRGSQYRQNPGSADEAASRTSAVP